MGLTWNELRYAVRALRRSPGFTLVALVVLAVGIGANTAVFSVVYNVLLKPLQYRDPGRLVVVLTTNANPVSPADYFDYQRDATAFDSLGAAQAWGGSLESGDRAEMIPGLCVAAGLLTSLGVPPERGRLFLPGEDKPGAAPVVIISHELWQRRFGADPSIVGRTVRIEGHPYTLVGVMPPGFRFAPFWTTETQMWAPLNLSDRLNDRAGRSLRVFGRLKQGLTPEQARAQMVSIGRRLERLYPRTNTGVGVELIPLREMVTGPVRPTLLVLLLTAALVLTIACANIANLLLTRAIGKRREIAVRLAIGAARRHLVLQLATESLVVSLAGGLLGIALAAWSLAALTHILPPASLPRESEIAMQPLVLLFALAVSALTGVASGIFPALESAGLDVNENLKQGGRGSVGVPQQRARGFLIAAEISLALVLLMCAGLMIRTLQRLSAVNAGFQPHNLLTMYVFAPPEKQTAEQRIDFFARVSRALASVPGVERVSATNHLPISGDVWTFGYSIPGRPALPPGQEPSAVYRVVRPDYFNAMRIPMIHGRGFTEADDARSAPVAVISERLAHHQWPGRNPVGETIDIPALPAPEPAPAKPATRFTIVGVSADVRQSEWTGEPNEEFYVPFLQHAGSWDQTHEAFVIRTAIDPPNLLTPVEAAVRAVSPRLSISELMPMEQVIGDKLWRSRVSTMLLAAFAFIALTLAAVGIYGVVAYSVRQRRQEVGIRMALGASRGDVLRAVTGESMRAVAAGLGAGVLLSLWAVRGLETLLYEIKPADPATFVSVVLSLVAVAAIAAIIPTWRATALDLSDVLRSE